MNNIYKWLETKNNYIFMNKNIQSNLDNYKKMHHFLTTHYSNTKDLQPQPFYLIENNNGKKSINFITSKGGQNFNNFNGPIISYLQEIMAILSLKYAYDNDMELQSFDYKLIDFLKEVSKTNDNKIKNISNIEIHTENKQYKNVFNPVIPSLFNLKKIFHEENLHKIINYQVNKETFEYFKTQYIIKYLFKKVAEFTELAIFIPFKYNHDFLSEKLFLFEINHKVTTKYINLYNKSEISEYLIDCTPGLFFNLETSYAYLDPFIFSQSLDTLDNKEIKNLDELYEIINFIFFHLTHYRQCNVYYKLISLSSKGKKVECYTLKELTKQLYNITGIKEFKELHTCLKNKKANKNLDVSNNLKVYYDLVVEIRYHDTKIKEHYKIFKQILKDFSKDYKLEKHVELDFNIILDSFFKLDHEGKIIDFVYNDTYEKLFNKYKQKHNLYKSKEFIKYFLLNKIKYEDKYIKVSPKVSPN